MVQQSNLKELIRYIIEVVCRFLTKIYGFFTPVKNNQILFYSYTGEKFDDSPKYIANYLNEKYPQKYQIIWAYKEKPFDDIPSNYSLVKYRSIQFIRVYLSSHIIVTDIYPFPLASIKRNQILIDTWHGGGAYKVAGFDATTSNIEKNRLKFFKKNISVFLSSSDAFKNYFIRKGLQYTGIVLDSGLPRNDIFYKTQLEKNLISARVHIKLGIDMDTHIVLYAPTWRKENEKEAILFNPDKIVDLFHESVGGKWCFVFRAHMKNIAMKYNSAIDGYHYEDMQELLLSSDALITDYSSCLWDFSLMGKPCIIYAYDLSCYDQERGFYIRPEKWGFPVCKNENELYETIQTLKLDESKKQCIYHYNLLKGNDDGHALERVSQYIEGVTD